MNDSSDEDLVQEDLVQATQEAEATLKRKVVEEVSSDSDNELLADSQSLEYLHDRELLPEIEVCIISEICYAFV